MARSAENGARRHGRWRKVVWGTTAVLWLLLQVAFGWNIVGTSILLLIPTATYELALALRTRSELYRVATCVALAAAFFLVLVNGAVGIIGSENQPANRMYAGVLLVGIIGAAIARFRPRRMTIALFATAFAQLLVPVLALVIWQSQLSWGNAGITGVFAMNAFFAVLFAASALLFRLAAQEQRS